MLYSRMSKRNIFINRNREYKKVFFENRDLKEMPQYGYPTMSYPTQAELYNLTTIPVMWGSTSRLTKIAYEFYGDPSLWWVIAHFNKTPLEADFSIGQIVDVPTPLNLTLEYMGF